MWGWIIRTISVALAIVATGVGVLSLYLATFACYGERVSCGKGWVARTIVTAVYLLVVAGIILLTRWLLRITAERSR